MFPRITAGIRMSQPLLWSSIIDKPNRTEDKKALDRQIPKNSFHQTPHITYPRPPSFWRKSTPAHHIIQPRIIEQPDPASLKRQCIYRKKLEKEKSKTLKKKSDFLLLKFVKVAKLKQKEIYPWNEKLKPERLKAVIKNLTSSVESEQLYAAQALGHLGVAEEHIVSALYNTLQECESLPLKYEIARSLALLGCLEETSVMKILIRHLKDVSLNRREDVLSALKVSLHAWSILPKYEHCIGAQSSLTRNLQRLVKLQEPTDNVSFNAAICLGYLDRSSSDAQMIMFRCLTQKDWKKKMEALVMLVHHMNIVDAVIIHTVLEQLRCSPVYKHRADSAKLLTTIGLETIQQAHLEDRVFNVLLEKLYEEPLLVVRQSVALAVEELKMKKRVWDIVEKKLRDENEEARKQAVISLGVLGLRHKNVFFTLLEMLDLDTSEEVRIQVSKTFSTLGMNNIHVRKSLKNKAQTDGTLARECAKALKILDKVPAIQKDLMLQSFWLH
ncbi:protein HEATR9 [Eublepharis macularius]|uniref:Protein HEATR9 n=1 Tax=Eublepharis macularius TaxID=481883 RepID=A0AA97KWY5_EUBMA|nr:protein HEATR9 [Eublepharis macularius]